jgi:hypothetical protein
VNTYRITHHRDDTTKLVRANRYDRPDYQGSYPTYVFRDDLGICMEVRADLVKCIERVHLPGTMTVRNNGEVTAELTVHLRLAADYGVRFARPVASQGEEPVDLLAGEQGDAGEFGILYDGSGSQGFTAESVVSDVGRYLVGASEGDAATFWRVTEVRL